MQYWIIKDGESKGPFTLEELKALNISETTKIWHKGLKNWTIAKDTDLATELFAPVLPETTLTEEPTTEAEQPITEEPQTTEEEPQTKIEEFNTETTEEIAQPAASPIHPTPPTPPAPPVFNPQNYSQQTINEAYQSGYRQGLKDGINIDSDTDPNRCPPTNLVWAILSTVLCCIPFGIVAIVYASKVSSKYAQGDLAGAWKASRYAAYWAIASFISSMIFFPLQVAMSFA